jgi:predicted transcriptional regulator
MTENKAKTDDGSDGSQLEGKWLDILKVADYGPDGKFTSKDLDDLVSDYQTRTTDKAPVVLGRVKGNMQPVGTVDEIRRNGDVLQAKLNKIDPRVGQLYSKGVFKKRSAAFERSSKGGISLVGVGLVSPQWHGQNQRMDDEITPSLDELEKQTFGTQSVIGFSEARGPVFNTGRIRVDPDSVRLSEAAKQLASEKSITFAEALGQVSTIQYSIGTQPSGKPQSSRSVIPADPNSVRLSELAKQRARDESITFSEALSQVASEQPELTKRNR